MDDQTDANWNAFLQYLRGRHGRTKKQEVYALLNGVSCDGRRPTDLAAIIKERTGRITLDDVRKEVLLKEIPPTVRQHLSSKIDTLTFKETAEECDKYFDMSGKMKEGNDATGINHVGVNRSQQQQQPQQQHPQQPTVSFTSTFDQEDVDPEVSAVPFRNGQRQQFAVSNCSSSRGRSGNSYSSHRGGYSNNNNNNNNNNGVRSNSNFSRTSNSGANNTNETYKKICNFHLKYGKEAI